MPGPTAPPRIVRVSLKKKGLPFTVEIPESVIMSKTGTFTELPQNRDRHRNDARPPPRPSDHHARGSITAGFERITIDTGICVGVTAIR